MPDKPEIIVVDAENVEKEGFFCYMSKKKSAGYANKLRWLKARFGEGLCIHLLKDGQRGFIETIPGENAWRAVNAAGYLFIHCIWVVGKSKGNGYGELLLAKAEERARAEGFKGVATVTTDRVWMAKKKLFVKNGYEIADEYKPFQLMVKRFDESASMPGFPSNWEERAQQCGEGLTIFRTDQCPYIEDAARIVREVAEANDIAFKEVRLEDAWTLQSTIPSPHGTFSIVHNGELLSYHYLTEKDLKKRLGL